MKYIYILIPFLRNHWQGYILGLVLLAIVDITQIAIPHEIGKAIDHLINKESSRSELINLSSIALIIAILRYYYRNFIMGATRKLEFFLRECIYIHALRLPMTYYDQSGPGKVMALMLNDINSIRVSTGFGMILLMDSIFIGVISAVVMVRNIDAGLAICSVLPLPTILVLATFTGKAIHNRFRNVQNQFSELTEFVQETFSGLKVIKAFSREAEFIERFSHINRSNYMENMVLAKVQGIYLPMTHVAPLLCYAIALLYGGNLIIKGIITVGEFSAFIGYLELIIWPVMGVGFLINIIQRGLASIERIGEFLSVEACEKKFLQQTRSFSSMCIDIKNLTFTYPSNSVPSLLNFSLSVSANTSVGIVGKTGSGKSTLLKLLLRLYNPPKDCIYISDTEIHNFDYSYLRQNIAYVPQNSFLFSQSIGENIAFDREYTLARIETAAQLSAVHEDINAKPLGFGTELGEKGRKLSGGQQQRVAIARAVIKEAPILLLDDVFSSLDYSTQRRLIKNLKETFCRRTVILVSQRVAVVREFDLIVAMKNGAIIEQGTHDQLINKRGYYYMLCEQQLESATD